MPPQFQNQTIPPISPAGEPKKSHVRLLLLTALALFLGGCVLLYISSQHVPKDSEPRLLQICPDEWIQNNMPMVGDSSELDRQYYILNGERRELAEFDNEWVASNCDLEKQVVY